MRVLSRRTAQLFFLIQAVTAVAQTSTFASPEAAIASMFQNKYVDWVSTDGDWNGDSIKDVAMILTQREPEEGPTQVRLVILAGVPGGGYLPLSASSSYCVAQKHFNLEASGPSLLVTAVHRLDELITDTLHFRFNKRLGDFELVGRENVYDDNSHGGYIGGSKLLYKRQHGRITQKKTPFAVKQLVRLNGFDCDKHLYGIAR